MAARRCDLQGVASDGLALHVGEIRWWTAQQIPL